MSGYEERVMIYDGLCRLAEEKARRLITEHALELLLAAQKHCGPDEAIIAVNVLMSIEMNPGSHSGGSKTIFVAGKTSLHRLVNAIKLWDWLRTGKLQGKVSNFIHRIGEDSYQIVAFPFP